MHSLTSVLKAARGLAGQRKASKTRRHERPVSPAEFDAADLEVYRYVTENELTMVSDERLFATLLACKYVTEAGIPGDFVECGVWRGGNGIVAADVFHRRAAERNVWLYDTFSGMTAPSDIDVTWRGKPALPRFEKNRREGYNAWCYATLEEVKSNFANAPRRCANTIFKRGDILELLLDPNEIPAEIGVLRLDTDWYESTKLELEVLYPRLSAGGILILDDYGHWSGVRKAVDEFFARVERPFFQYTDYAGRVGVKIR